MDSFVKFFERNGHHLLPPSPLIASGDSGTLFTIAGMVQFNDYFMESIEPTYKDVITVQPCIRVNDLDIVGKTKIHHTFFEMLGVFSFGGYGKERAITLIYEFLFKELRIPTEYIYITVYTHDQATYHIWSQLISKDRILLSDHNLWKSMGPGGYCTEIFFTQRKDPPKEILKGIEDGEGDIVELGNIVFVGDKPLVDIGLGLERLEAAIKGGIDTYDTKWFIVERNDFLLADHAKSILFLISEGLEPSAESHGYILRKLIRKLLLEYSTADIKKKIVSYYELYKPRYPSLSLNLSLIDKEYSLFKPILDTAEEKLSTITDEGGVLRLQDTYGVPKELSIAILERRGINIDFKKLEEISQQSLIPKVPTIIKCYETTSYESEVTYIDETVMVTKASCFYARGGGQPGDQGSFKINGCVGKITDTIRHKLTPNNYVVIHKIDRDFPIHVGDKVYLQVKETLRDARTRAHSSVHIVHDILLKEYKDCTIVSTSVGEDKFHLDIEEREPDLPHLAKLANQLIAESIESSMVVDQAGTRTIEFSGNHIYSKQPCGGTHVKNTKDIGHITLVKLTSIKANTKRLYGVCGNTTVSKPPTKDSYEEIYKHFIYMVNLKDSKALKAIKNGIPIVLLCTDRSSRLIIDTAKTDINIDRLSNRFGLKGVTSNHIARLGSKDKISPKDLDEYLCNS